MRAARALGLPAPAPTDGGGWSSLRTQGVLAGVDVDLSGSLRVEGPGGLLHGGAAAEVEVAAGHRGGPARHPGAFAHQHPCTAGRGGFRDRHQSGTRTASPLSSIAGTSRRNR